MIYLNNLTQWSLQNEELKKQLQLESVSTQVRVYNDLSIALLENVAGMMSFLAHKKSLILHKGVSSCYEFLLPQFYREVIQIQWINKNELVSYDLNTIKKDTNLAVIFEDHPITAEEYPWQKINEELNARKIFVFRISFHRHKNEKAVNIDPYSIRICYDEDKTYLVCGEKFKVPPSISPYLNNKHQSIELNKKIIQGLQLVSDFEKWMSEVFQAKPFLPLLVSRYPDRSLHILKNHSADFVKQYMINKNQKYEKHIFTLSSCEHGFMKPLSSWWDGAPSEEDQSGFIGFSAESITWSETKNHIQQALTENI